MAAAQGDSDVIFLRGVHLSFRFLRKAPRTCQSDFNDPNENNCKGKMFWLTRYAAGLSGMFLAFVDTIFQVSAVFWFSLGVAHKEGKPHTTYIRLCETTQ